MIRYSLQAVLASALLVLFTPRAEAQSPYPASYAQPKKIVIDPNPRSGPPVAVGGAVAGVVVVPEQPGVVQLDAPLYPCPRQNIPYQVGYTLITNQALAPHEFLYPHSYRALYPPYYYRVKGKWWGAFGWSYAHDTWELQGTEVEVNYRSSIPLKYRNPFLSILP